MHPPRLWHSLSAAAIAAALISSAKANMPLCNFADWAPDGFGFGWTSSVSTATNWQVSGSGFGDAHATASFSVNSNATLQVNLSLTAPSGATGSLTPIVVLQDGDGTLIQYAWPGQSPGTNLVLTMPLNQGQLLTNYPGTIPGFDFTTVSYFHLQLDPGGFAGTYTISWNDLSAVGTNTSISASINAFHSRGPQFLFNAWQSGATFYTPTSFQVAATGFGNGSCALSPLSLSSNNTLELNLTMTADSTANGQLAPIVVLQDENGSIMQYAWYGRSPGTNLLLTMALNHGTLITNYSTTTNFDWSHVSWYQLQFAPNAFTGTYTVAWNDLSVWGGPPAFSGISTSLNPVAPTGVWGSWNTNNTVYTPTNFQVSAGGFGAGADAISPPLAISSNLTLRLELTLAANSTANGQLTPIVVFQDGLGDQVKYAWYGCAAGTNLVLTLPLNAGQLVSGASFDWSSVSFYQIQLDTGPFFYTATWSDLSIIGVLSPFSITSANYNPASKQFTLTWTSENGATYAIMSSTNLASGFADLLTGIASGGTSTTATFPLADPNRSYVRIRSQ